MTQTAGPLMVTLRNGGAMPALGFGTWKLTGAQAYDAVRTALEVGYRHIDTATMYGNETEVGRAVRDSGITRGDIFITTKLPPDRAGDADSTLAASLTALGTDYVDLWLIHWPPRAGMSIPAWRSLLGARDRGVARAVGVSNYSPALVDELIDETDDAPAVNQIPWSPFAYDAEVASHSASCGVVLEGYSPFKRSKLDHPVLREIADTHGVEPTQVILRWHVDHGVVVIPKSATPARIAANFDIWGFRLDPGEIARIDALAS